MRGAGYKDDEDDDRRWRTMGGAIWMPGNRDIGWGRQEPFVLELSRLFRPIQVRRSLRIHQREMQERVFRLLGIGEEEAKARFGHMLEAFEYGAPPHAGFAPGLDRIIAQLAGETDIREVIAFPKTKSANDPMTGAPSTVKDEQLEVLGIRVVEEPEKQ